MMRTSMKAVVLQRPGPPEVLTLQERPVPQPKPGWVLVRVRAFGLNRSELFTRQGRSPSVALPRILGIEAVGEIVAAPGTELLPGPLAATPPAGPDRASVETGDRHFASSIAETVEIPTRRRKT